jgi:indole-3-pyruvate monooxygenase
LGESQKQTLIIGGGPAGLAAAACLKQRGLPYLLLEQQSSFGSAWRNHYDRLHLHTPRDHSALPHLPMPKEYPTYPSRQQVVDYLDAYAEKFGVQARFGVTVNEVAPDGDGWTVRSSAGTFHGKAAVICTGYNRVPVLPEWEGRTAFRGEVLHSSRYKNGESWRGRRVLVVGAGNSGAEIALDLLEHGAKPLLCIRGPIHVISRDLGPVPAMNVAVALVNAPVWLKDALVLTGSRLTYGDLSRFGIRRPEKGPISQITVDGRIPLIDIGTIGAIKRGEIEVVPGIERFTAEGVTCVDGKSHTLDAVVLATGFQTGLQKLMPTVSGVFNARGLPKSVAAMPEAPRLYFIGFENPETGFLRQIGIRAQAVGEALSRDLAA